MNITLPLTELLDLETLFHFQADAESVYLAAFTPKDPTDKAYYIERYTGFLANPTIHMRTIKWNDQIVGSIAKFIIENDTEITYGINRAFWGKGIATKALQQFLELETTRPIFGRVAFDNVGSQKVMEKNGFVRIGEDTGFANARQAEIKEFIYRKTKR